MDKQNPTSAVERLAQSIDDLDLETLPERLDDQQLAMVRRIADAPLPSLPPANERDVGKCLRAMLAVLPRQQSDELSGELFVEVYLRQLGDMPGPKVVYMMDQAIRQCRWFPTVAECLEIASGWRRVDADTMRRAKASERYNREMRARDPIRPAKPVDDWQPDREELERIKRDVANSLRANRHD